MLGIWSLVPLPFLNPAWTSEISQFTFYWSLTWRILSISFLAYEMSAKCGSWVVWTFFGIAFVWDWNENWLFPVLWPLLSFPNLLAFLDFPKWCLNSCFYSIYICSHFLCFSIPFFSVTVQSEELNQWDIYYRKWFMEIWGFTKVSLQGCFCFQWWNLKSRNRKRR